MPVGAKQEPPHFDAAVRQRGLEFLATTKRPTSQQWNEHAYWRSTLNDLREAYASICSYSALWISATGGSSVDHFVPKSANPGLAYEWTNFRLAAALYNSRKGNYRDVLDPFTLASNSFVLDFPSLLIAPHLQLDNADANSVHATINRLGLNDEISVKSRLVWLLPYCTGELTLSFLKRKAPFIAHELHRQGLEERIGRIMIENHREPADPSGAA